MADKNPIVNAAYYFIDMVKITELSEPVLAEYFSVGKYFIGEGIYFDRDQYHLNDSSHAYLDKLVLFLKEHPEKKIKVEGHTDSIGSKEYNYLLSEKRAMSVKDYLVKKDISKDRITIHGWGMDKPIDERKSLLYLNRRIEILFE